MQRKNSLSFAIYVLAALLFVVIMTSCQGGDSAPEQPGAATLVSTATQTETPFPTATPTATPLPSLRSLAKEHDFYVGTAVDPGWLYGEKDFADLVAREFNMLTPEVAMKWEVIHPQRDYYDFSRGDQVVEFARLNSMLVRGHPLVWDLQLPSWVLEAYEEDRFTRDEWIAILRGHVKTLAGHYRGQIYAWDVVNEGMTNEGTLRETIWLKTIGPEYIAMAFRWAHEADPYALLFYNDNGGEGMNAKSDAIYALVDGLLQEGVPIHGVGLQHHVWLGGQPTAGDLRANIQRLSDLGLRVHITEMDVRTQYSKESEEKMLELQAEMYQRVFSACLDAPKCEAFVTWGATDRQSWIPGFTGQPDMPLLFDESYQPKPAYDAIMKLLEEAGE